MAEHKGWTVTTTQQRPLSEIEHELVTAGFQVAQVLEAIGCITGTADEEVVQRIRQLSEVAGKAGGRHRTPLMHRSPPPPFGSPGRPLFIRTPHEDAPGNDLWVR